MVTTTIRKVVATSESTITNSGRISPPDWVPATPPSDDDDDDEEEEDEKEDLPQPLPLALSTSTSALGAAAPLSTVIRSVPPRATSNGTAISALTVESTASLAENGTEDEDLANYYPPATNTNTTTTTTIVSAVPVTSPPPPLPPPIKIFTEARDVSGSSRDSLRRQVLKRKMSLTIQEQKYLGDLLIHGNEVEVQLAFEKLQDEELFFDHQTPKHYMGQPLVYWEHGSIQGGGGGGAEQASSGSKSYHSATEGEESTDNTNANDGRPTLERCTSQGSQRRLQALEQRKNSIQHLTLWRAHQSGLAVTSSGSRNSLIKRTTSIGSSSSSGIPRPPPSGDIFRPGRHHQHHRRASTSSTNSNRVPMIPPKPSAAAGGGIPRNHHRSKSMLIPAIPPPARMSRRFSTNSSRKSVTFHKETDGTPKPKSKKLLRRSVSDTNALMSSSSSSSSAGGFLLIKEPTVPEDQQQQVGGATPPPPPPRPLAERQESASSIPSLHHAHPIRQDSVSSIPSLHHGFPIRQESVSSIPSLHHGHLLREESIASIPSIHHGHLIREESIASIPSLHPGLPIRQESEATSTYGGPFSRSNSIMSVPSLHHAHPLMDDTSTVFSGADRHPSQVNIPPQFATHDIANVWLQQPGQGQPLSSSQNRESSDSSLPHAVTIPTNDTDQTYPSTAGTVTTAASSAHWDDDDDDDAENQEVDPQGSTHSNHSSGDGSAGKPVLMRLASRNAYEGEGIEVTQLHDQALAGGEGSTSHFRNSSPSTPFPGMISMDASIRTCNSWDTALSSYQPHPEIFRGVIGRSLSDEDMAPIFLGSGAQILLKDNSGTYQSGRQISGYREIDEDDGSWDMNSDGEAPRYDSWNVLKDEYVNGYGGGDSLDFMILGTDADDEASQPHVLSPPLMESLQAFLPLTKSGQNFYLKYSMVRDGASLHTFLKRARGVQYSILAIETVDGEVFGCFTAQPWRKNWNYFGTGESFLWKMRRSRLEKTHDILEQAQMESEIEVFPYTGENRFIQLCTHDRIAVGGGTPSEKKLDDDSGAFSPLTTKDTFIQPHEWGFGLAIDGDLLTGTTSPCVTFASPSLSNVHSKGSVFEIVNMELWTLTPCRNVEEAEKLELGKLFLERG